MSLSLSVGLWLVSPTPANAMAAVVIKDAACFLLDGFGVPHLVTESVAIGTFSTPLNSQITCKASGLPPNPSGQMTWDTTNWPPPTGGGQCFTYFGVTARWNNVVSSSGQVTLSCEYPTTH
jgi:hypothetical protein